VTEARGTNVEIVDWEVFQLPSRTQFLRLETDTGVVGWGEPLIEGRPQTTAAAVDELAAGYLDGADPPAIRDHWEAMYRHGFSRGGPILMGAISGIDQALWDIKGKYYEAPVYDLLGGKVRDRIRMYHHVGGESLDELRANTEDALDRGFVALKTSPTDRMRQLGTPASIERARERLAAIREVAGPEVDVGLDFHGRVSRATAPRLAAALEEYDPMFYEEVVTPEHNDALPEIAAHTTVPIATGERLYSRWDFKHVFEAGIVDVVQPDVSHCGGITELRCIADMAEAYDVAVVPHCAIGPVALASCLHVGAQAYTAVLQEQTLLSEGRRDMLSYLDNSSVFDVGDGGFVELPDGPGLGLDLDESTVRERASSGLRTLPEWRHEDGSVAEW
jgi:galactonate dehydratase